MKYSNKYKVKKLDPWQMDRVLNLILICSTIKHIVECQYPNLLSFKTLFKDKKVRNYETFKPALLPSNLHFIKVKVGN
ncbi:hypothetical protein GGGNBK_12750 [Sporosarcina sp. ANT_H38]